MVNENFEIAAYWDDFSLLVPNHKVASTSSFEYITCFQTRNFGVESGKGPPVEKVWELLF